MKAEGQRPTPAWQASRRADLYALHRKWNRGNFDGKGAWAGAFPRHPINDSREWLWHALAFLEGDAADVAMGNLLVKATPNVANHFNPIAAALILLRHKDQLLPAAREHLIAILNDCLAEARDFGFAVNGTNNFSAMWAFLHLASSQILETYQPAYPHRSIPEVYNKYRMRQFGLNVLRLMEAQLSRSDLASEFNSPTYSPIALMHLAEIVNLIAYEPAREIAARLESRLWRELLGFHHPLLRQASGPHSRAYTVDTIGHASGWKVVCCFLGLDGPATVADLLYPPPAGQVLHGSGDLAHQQCFSVWLARADYHPPEAVLKNWRERTFPFTFRGAYEWPGSGFRRSDGALILNVEGEDGVRPGWGIATCRQEETFAIGSMSRTYAPLNRPCRVVYRLSREDSPLGSVRSASLLMFSRRMADWAPNPIGTPIPPVSLPNTGEFETLQDGVSINGTARPYHWAPQYGGGEGCDEISFNLLIGEHLPAGAPVESVRLGNQPFDGKAMEHAGKKARFEIEDGFARIVLDVELQEEGVFRVTRRAGFLRCAAVLFEGAPRAFTKEELEKMTVRFHMDVKKRR